MMSQVTTFFSLYRRSRTLAWCTHVHTHTHTPKWRSRDVTKLCGNIFLSPCSFAPVDWERGREEENLRGGEGIEGNLIFLLVDTIVEKYFSFQRKTNKKAWKFKEESFISIYFEYLYYGTFFSQSCYIPIRIRENYFIVTRETLWKVLPEYQLLVNI